MRTDWTKITRLSTFAPMPGAGSATATPRHDTETRKAIRASFRKTRATQDALATTLAAVQARQESRRVHDKCERALATIAALTQAAAR